MKASSIGRRAAIRSTSSPCPSCRLGLASNRQFSLQSVSSSTQTASRIDKPERNASHLPKLKSHRPSLGQTRGLATQSKIQSSHLQQVQDVDAVIVGAGVVGLALACSMGE